MPCETGVLLRRETRNGEHVWEAETLSDGVGKRMGKRVKRKGKRSGKEALEEGKEYLRQKHISIPPGYTHVKICKPGSKMLYEAKDAKGRTQRMYSKDYNKKREETAKPEHFKHLTSKVWNALDAAVSKAVREKEWSPDKLAATAILLIQSCFFRPGTRSADVTGEGDAHFGVLTLQHDHLKLSHKKTEKVKFEFTGKAGKTNTCELRDNKLANLMKSLLNQNKQNKRLFSLKGKNLSIDETRTFIDNAVQSVLVNVKLRLKDIRTYKANLTFLDAFLHHPQRHHKDRLKKTIKECVEATAQRLNNTPKMAKDSYILVPVMQAAEHGLKDTKMATPLLFDDILKNWTPPPSHALASTAA